VRGRRFGLAQVSGGEALGDNSSLPNTSRRAIVVSSPPSAGQPENLELTSVSVLVRQLLRPAGDSGGPARRLLGHCDERPPTSCRRVQAVRFDERAAVGIHVAQRDFAISLRDTRQWHSRRAEFTTVRLFEPACTLLMMVVRLKWHEPELAAGDVATACGRREGAVNNVKQSGTESKSSRLSDAAAMEPEPNRHRNKAPGGKGAQPQYASEYARYPKPAPSRIRKPNQHKPTTMHGIMERSPAPGIIRLPIPAAIVQKPRPRSHKAANSRPRRTRSVASTSRIRHFDPGVGARV